VAVRGDRDRRSAPVLIRGGARQAPRVLPFEDQLRQREEASVKKTPSVFCRAFLPLLLLASPAAGLEVTMSRYVLKVQHGLQTSTIDQSALDSLCKDEDGCAVIVSLELDNVDFVSVDEVRLRMQMLPAPLHPGWATSGEVKAAGFDGNGVIETVALATEATPVLCRFSDADDQDFADDGVGFVLRLSGSNPGLALGVCTLVLVD
jgi:hypothetical protein